jgi:hypothetical protein
VSLKPISCQLLGGERCAAIPVELFQGGPANHDGAADPDRRDDSLPAKAIEAGFAHVAEEGSRVRSIEPAIW